MLHRKSNLEQTCYKNKGSLEAMALEMLSRKGFWRVMELEVLFIEHKIACEEGFLGSYGFRNAFEKGILWRGTEVEMLWIKGSWEAMALEMLSRQGVGSHGMRNASEKGLIGSYCSRDVFEKGLFGS